MKWSWRKLVGSSWLIWLVSTWAGWASSVFFWRIWSGKLPEGVQTVAVRGATTWTRVWERENSKNSERYSTTEAHGISRWTEPTGESAIWIFFFKDTSLWKLRIMSTKRESQRFSKKRKWEFPGGPGVKTWHFDYRGPGFNPWSGNYDPTSCSVAKNRIE